MQYYIRQDKDADIRGPFTVDELAERLNIGTIPDNSLASSNIGDPIDRLRDYRECDWFPLSQIPELQHLLPPSQPGSEARARPPATMRSTVLQLTCALLLGYGAAAGHDWWLCLLAVAILWLGSENIVRLMKQKEQARNKHSAGV